MKFLKHDVLINLKWYQRRLLTLAIVFFIYISWLIFVYTNIENKINIHTNLLNKIIKKKHLLETSKQDCKKINNKIKFITSTLDNYKSNKNSKTGILEFAKSAGISLKTYTTMNTKNKASYEFTGGIKQVLIFCKKLKECKEALECLQVSVTKKNKNKCSITCMLQLLD